MNEDENRNCCVLLKLGTVCFVAVRQLMVSVWAAKVYWGLTGG
jgi:hypothetical protein